MITLTSLDETREALEKARNGGSRIGFVPTMGYLHEGHLSLVRAARRDCDIVAASIFVNPTQFGPSEDLEKYPRDAERDSSLLKEAGTDFLFFPTKETLYPPGFSTSVRVDGLTENFCGASRPWHFPGVTLIVCKLFNIVRPHAAYFGQKDFQQACVIRRMVRDLDFGIDIRVCSIVREGDGLAMSSRNTYLSEEERAEAVFLSQALRDTNERYLEGERDPVVLRRTLTEQLEKASLGEIEYAQVADGETLLAASGDGEKWVALVAIQFPGARLIDNHILGQPFPGGDEENG